MSAQETDRRTRRRTKPGIALLVPLALIASSAVVYQASNAAFTATTDNAGNSWQAGTVALSDNDSGAALFNVSNLAGGSTGSRCIQVSYTGSLASDVRLYATNVTGTLGQYLDWSVDLGQGSNPDCSDFNPSVGNIYTGTLGAFATARTDWATGVPGWTPGGTQDRSYRFTYTLQDTNAAQGLSAGARLVWEARNT